MKKTSRLPPSVAVVTPRAQLPPRRSESEGGGTSLSSVDDAGLVDGLSSTLLFF